MIEGLDNVFALIGSPETLIFISFVGVLVVVLVVVLPIVLFFKLWGMANNVKKMTKIMESNQVHADELWTD